MPVQMSSSIDEFLNSQRLPAPSIVLCDWKKYEEKPPKNKLICIFSMRKNDSKKFLQT